MWKRLLLIAVATVTGFIGMAGFDAYQASRSEAGSVLAATIGAPYCTGQRGGAPVRTFFRAAMAQADTNARPPRTEVAPFGAAVPTAESIANADADPKLTSDLGTLHYTITTSSPLAQRFFDQGLRLAYAFNHGEALRAFRKASALDPNCAMCYWGEALVLGPNINAPMDAASVTPAYAAASKAAAAATNQTQKERALIAALTKRYSQDPNADRSVMDKAYADAMQAVAASYPDDDQVVLLYVESLMDLQPWDYWNATGTEAKGRAAEVVALVERVLARSQNHPGAIHFYIHLTESSSDPHRAIPYARRLGRLMPGAGHLVHMPFHTFFRVGMYKEAIAANKEAVRVDERYIARSAPVGMYPVAYYPHNVHSLMVSAQMAGDGATVIASADKLGRIVADDVAKQVALLQPVKSAPYFAHAQFSDAATIMSLSDPGDDFPYVQAMWRYARAVGLAHDGNTNGAKRETDAIEKLLQEGNFENLTAFGIPAKETLQIALHVAQGRIAQATTDWDTAVRHFESAVALEDALAYAEPPNWYYPTRQSLGASLALAGELDEAERVLRASLQRWPNNGWALYGLTKVYEQRGNRADARAAKRLFNKAWLGKTDTLTLTRL